MNRTSEVRNLQRLAIIVGIIVVISLALSMLTASAAGTTNVQEGSDPPTEIVSANVDTNSYESATEAGVSPSADEQFDLDSDSRTSSVNNKTEQNSTIHNIRPQWGNDPLDLEIKGVSDTKIAPGETLTITFEYDSYGEGPPPGVSISNAVEYAQDRRWTDRLLTPYGYDIDMWSDLGGEQTHSLSYETLTTDDDGNKHGDDTIDLYVQTTDALEDTEDLEGESDPVEIEFVDNPSAQLDWYPDPGSRAVHIGETVTFDAYSSEPGENDAYIAEMKMDLNDDGEWDESTTGDGVISHSFDDSGFYEVTMKVVDSNGKTDITSRLVAVNEPPEADFEHNPENPVVGAGEFDTTVEFDASAADPGNSVIDEIDEYEWWFSAPGHQFGATGETISEELTARTYDVTLTITDDDYETDSITKTVTVEELDPANFVTEITDKNSPVEAGETLEVTAEIENTGDVSESQTIEIDVPGLGSDSTTVHSLDGGDSTTETLTVSTNADDAGSYSATVELDDDSDSTSVEVDPQVDTLSITSAPDDASVYLDGEYVGTTPWSEDRPVTDSYEIEVDADGYESVTHSGVSAPANEHFDLDADTETLSVTSTPDDADVYVDGDYVGTTPWSEERPVTESYEIEVDADGYESATRSGVSPPEEEHFDLDAETDTLSITSTPEGADIYVDGEYVGETPWSEDRPVTESYEIEVDADDYDSVTRTLSPPANEHFDLETEAGTLSITSTPEDADIYLDGEHVGNTPWSEDRPVTESYEIKVDADGYEPEVRSDVSPPADEEFTLEETTDGEIRAVDHPSVVAPDGSFTVAIDTDNTSSAVVEFASHGDASFDLELSSDDAVAIDGDRVEFLDPTTEGSTHEIDVDITGGQPADGGEIRVWVNAEDQADADDELMSTFELGDTHPSGVSQTVWDGVTDKNTPVNDLTFQDLDDTIQAYHDGTEVNGVDLAFQDLIDLIMWYQSDEPATMTSAETLPAGVTPTADGTVTLTTDETVTPGGETTVSVETEVSAGTVVEFDPDGVSVALASEDAVSIDENRVEFLDANASRSTYEIDVDVDDGADGDTVDIDAWVNAENRIDAEDTATATLEIVTEDESIVTGIITTVDGNPVENVDVEVVDPATDETEAVDTTDDDGSYSLELTPDQTYELVVEAEGFEPFTTEVTVETDRVHTEPIVLSPADENSEDDGAPRIEDYANDEGVVGADGVQDAFADWQAGEIESDLLQDVFGAWQSGSTIAD